MLYRPRATDEVGGFPALSASERGAEQLNRGIARRRGEEKRGDMHYRLRVTTNKAACQARSAERAQRAEQSNRGSRAAVVRRSEET